MLNIPNCNSNVTTKKSKQQIAIGLNIMALSSTSQQLLNSDTKVSFINQPSVTPGGTYLSNFVFFHDHIIVIRCTLLTFTHVYQLQNNGRQQNICIIIIGKKNAGHYGNLLLVKIIIKVLSKRQIPFYC